MDQTFQFLELSCMVLLVDGTLLEVDLVIVIKDTPCIAITIIVSSVLSCSRNDLMTLIIDMILREAFHANTALVDAVALRQDVH